jgi:hypothetical protein
MFQPLLVTDTIRLRGDEAQPFTGLLTVEQTVVTGAAALSESPTAVAGCAVKF